MVATFKADEGAIVADPIISAVVGDCSRTMLIAKEETIRFLMVE